MSFEHAREQQGKGVSRTAFSVDEHCLAEGISRAKLYGEWKAGRGPRYYHRGARRLISVEAADEYRRSLEEAAAAANESA